MSTEPEFQGCDIREATWVKVDNEWYEIRQKWGINPDGTLAKPSEGGFGCVIGDGVRIDMWRAGLYGKQA